MPPIPLRELMETSKATLLGELDPEFQFRWIERNSRAVQPGDLLSRSRARCMMGMISSPTPPIMAPWRRWCDPIGSPHCRGRRFH